MYGLPDSAIYGTYRRIRRTVKRRRSIETPESQLAWVWGWASVAVLYGVARLVLSITG
jgi:hypothetical protein